MTIPRSFTIVGVTALPLAVLTAMAFVNSGSRTIPKVDPPAVPASVDDALQKARDALKGKDAAEQAATADPAGFRGKADGPAAQGQPYAAAALLAEAAAAEKSGDPERTDRALASLADATVLPVTLQDEVSNRRQRLDRHRKWLANRKDAEDALQEANAAMLAGITIPGAKKCLGIVDDLRGRLPKVVTAEAAAEEPGDALTGKEAEEATRLRNWADCRSRFLTLQARHQSLPPRPEDLNGLVQEWDRFLDVHGRPGAPDPDSCVGKAKQFRAEARLAFLRADALAQTKAAAFAPAVLAWLDEPRADPGDAAGTARRGEARKLVVEWLERTIPSAPRVPAGLDGMEEGIIDDKQKGRRLIAIFQEMPGQKDRYRWWYTPAERTDEAWAALGRDAAYLRGKPTPPKCLAWAADYKDARTAFIADGFTTDSGNFAAKSRLIAQEFGTHMAIPAFRPEEGKGKPVDVDETVKGWKEVFERAAMVASEFAAACGESGLVGRLQGNAP